MVPAIEYNGDVFSCDHFVQPEWMIGNINSVNISDLLKSKKQIIFGQSKKSALPGYCIARSDLCATASALKTGLSTRLTEKKA